MYCGYNVTAEDCDGEKWMFRCVPEEDDDYFPLAILDEDDAEFLFSKTVSRRYALRRFTDDGFSARFHGPFKVLMAACMSAVLCTAWTEFVQLELGWLRWILVSLTGVVLLWGISEVIAGIIYNRHPLSLAAYRFYHNPGANKKSLEALLKKTINNT